jgi:hypothetical protein
LGKILLVDIETAPKLALVWRFFKQNISPKQVLAHGHIMSYAAKWLGEDEIYYQESRKEDDTTIVRSLLALLDEADIVIAHNGENFDFPQICARAIVHGMKPPSPYKIVDTYKAACRYFAFPSNSLEYLSTVLGCTPKESHKKFPGFELWLECLRNNDAAWEEMREYNIQDVITLEELYLKMRPWINNHPNMAVYETHNKVTQCPKCNSANLQWRGYAYTQVGKFHRFQCQDCGGWGRTRSSQKTKAEKAVIVVNQVN